MHAVLQIFCCVNLQGVTTSSDELAQLHQSRAELARQVASMEVDVRELLDTALPTTPLQQQQHQLQLERNQVFNVRPARINMFYVVAYFQ